MADRRDDGREARGDRADEPLVGERQQVLDRAAAARDDDDVDLGAARRARARRRSPRSTALTPCTATSRISNTHAGPAPTGVLDDVALGVAARARRRARRGGAGTGSGFLRAGSNRPSAASRFLRASSWASSSPRPTGRISVGAERERAAGGVVLRPWRARRRAGPRPAAGRRRRARAGEHVTVTDMSASVSRSVRNAVAGAGAPGELGDLALDPHRAEPGDVALDRAARSCGRRAGCSGEVSRATARSLGERAACRRGERAAREADPRAADLRWSGDRTRDAPPPPPHRARRCCSPPRAATAPASTARWSRWRRPSSSTAPPSTCARRSCTTSTWWRRCEARGAIFVEETDEVPEGSIVVFSAHGVAPSVHEEAAARNLRTIDATCPLVTKVHQEARRFADEGYRILLIGHEGHEEVVGTTGRGARGDHARRRSRRTPTRSRSRADEKVVWLSQTTLSVDETIETVDRLRTRLPLLVDPPSDDICYATQNRQLAVKDIAAALRRARRGRQRQLLELGAPRRGRPRGRAHAPPTASTPPSELAGGVVRRRRRRSVSPAAPRCRRSSCDGVLELAGRARLRRRRGGALRRGAPDVRPAAGAAPRPQGRRHAPDPRRRRRARRRASAASVARRGARARSRGRPAWCRGSTARYRAAC